MTWRDYPDGFLFGDKLYEFIDDEKKDKDEKEDNEDED